jgi:hypothetical protein
MIKLGKASVDKTHLAEPPDFIKIMPTTNGGLGQESVVKMSPFFSTIVAFCPFLG